MDILLIIFFYLYLLPLIICLLLFPVIHFLAKKEGTEEEVPQDLVRLLSVTPIANIGTMIELIRGTIHGLIYRRHYFKGDDDV